MSIETRPLHPQVGVELPGLVLGAERSEAERAELRALWLEHGLLLIHDPEVTSSSQIALSRGFGELEVHPLGETVRSREHEELLVLGKGSRPGQLAGCAQTAAWFGPLAAFAGPPKTKRSKMGNRYTIQAGIDQCRACSGRECTGGDKAFKQDFLHHRY